MLSEGQTPEKLHRPGPQWADEVHKPAASVHIEDKSIGEGKEVKSLAVPVGFIEGMHEPEGGVSLVLGVDEMEYILTNELVISVHNNLDIILVAERESRVNIVVGGIFMVEVLHECDPVFGEFQPLQFPHGFGESVIGGVIIDENNVEIVVVLPDDAPDYLLLPVVLLIVVAKYAHAQRELRLGV